MNTHNPKPLHVYPMGQRLVVFVPGGRGEELRIHLGSHAIEATVRQDAGTQYERLEVAGDADAVTLQAILDNWER